MTDENEQMSEIDPLYIPIHRYDVTLFKEPSRLLFYLTVTFE